MIKELKKNISNRLSNLISPQNRLKVEYLSGLSDPKAGKAIQNLRNGRHAVYYVPNVLKQQDQQRLLDYFAKKRENENLKSDFLDVYPESFYTYGYQGELTEKYFNGPMQVNRDLIENAGLDLNQMIYQLLENLNGGKKVTAKPANKEGGQFHSFQFRALNKRQSNIFLHCENMILKQMEHINARLVPFDVKPNAIPYFVCLQEAEGGEIVLFDYPWREGQYSDTSDNENQKIVDPKDGPIECFKKDVAKRTIAVKAGDMIIFNGGTTWHMVNNVQGPLERVTLGGFIEPQDNGELRLWA